MNKKIKNIDFQNVIISFLLACITGLLILIYNTQNDSIQEIKAELKSISNNLNNYKKQTENKYDFVEDAIRDHEERIVNNESHLKLLIEK